MHPLSRHLLAAKLPLMPNPDSLLCMAAPTGQERYSRAGRNVNLIPGVSQDEDGVIHTPYGSYHPVTGEGLPIDAREELMRAILIALIDDGLESGPAKPFDWDAFMAEQFPDS